MTADRDPLLSFDRATVVRPDGTTAFRDLTWTVHPGETWAVVGPVGAGKTTLAEVLIGRHWVSAGTAVRPAGAVKHLAFKEESRLFSYGRHYYQQRFNFIEPQDDLTLDAFLRAGTSATDEELHAAAQRLGVGELLSLSFIKLSNGQTRRARIAKALLAKPDLLILDEPFLGLDAAGRRDVADLLGGLVRGGVRVLLITRPDAIPAWVTQVLELGPPPQAQPLQRVGLPSAPCGRGETGPPRIVPSPLTAEPIIELYRVTVAYDGRPILDDVSWTVRAGERWAVVGPNGSGKTTLLSLVCGDHPQAYSNDVRLFGQRRGTGESIWDVKRRLGLTSPELHLYFTEPLTAIETAATGFFDVLARRRTTPEQDAALRELFAEFGLTELAERPFVRLSTGEQRLVLLVRALVKRPPLVILDEPFQGLDEAAIRRARDWLDERLRPEQTLVFVSHYEEEVPRTVGRRLRLDAGRVVEVD